MDKYSLAHLSHLYPPLAEKLTKLCEILQSDNLRITQGLRTWTQQTNLYAQGRTEPGVPCWHGKFLRPIGSCQEHPLGATVTKAQAGYSWHNYGLAADVAPDDPSKPGWQPDWNPKSPVWQRIVDVGQSLGLVSGISFQDLPHFEMTGNYGKVPPSGIRMLYQEQGLTAVWDSAFKNNG